MFQDCTSLTVAPSLPATTLAQSCYDDMFANCVKLSSINVAFTDWKEDLNATQDWVYNVAASGTFIKPTALPLSTGIHNIPEGWTVVNK